MFLKKKKEKTPEAYMYISVYNNEDRDIYILYELMMNWKIHIPSTVKKIIVGI